MIHIKHLKEITFVYAIFISLFHFYINVWGGISDLWFNSAHFALLASLGFLTYEATKNEGKNENMVSLSNIIFAVLSLVTFIYMVFFEESLYATNDGEMRMSDIIVASMTIGLAIEMVRKSTGYIIPVIITFCIAYLLFLGQYFEGVFAFAGMNPERFLYRMYYTSEGMFGSIATISSTYVYMFILFAAFLLKSGAGDFIVDLARGVTSKYTGGAGHVAVFSSALMGTISGSAVANTVSTGSITIPMMKKSGFKPTFAAAVETAASTGGQIMPPIMGAGAFIMAQMTNIPFVTIISVSVLPAILYFASISFYIHIHAKEENIRGEEEKVDILGILREGFHFLIPLVTLVGLLVYGFSPTYSAGISIIAIIASSYLTKHKKMGIKQIIEALALGAQNMVVTGVLLVAVGIIVGIINITGVGITFSQLIIEWSNNSLMLALILVALASLVLGMGLPVTASYVVLSVLCAPALVGLMLSPEMAALVNAGIELPEVAMYLLAAHLIIFWLSQDSNLTPPVCLAAFAAAAIAKTPPMRTGFMAWKVGKGMYIVPLLFAFTPLVTGTFWEQFEIFIFALFGILTFAIAVEGFWDKKTNIVERALFAISSLLLLSPDKMFGYESMFGIVQNNHIIGLSLFVLLMVYHKISYRNIQKRSYMLELLETLKKCGYNPYFVETKEEALELSKTFIKDGMSIGLGGSTTVSQIGLLDEVVNNKNITLHNQYEKGISMEENIKRRREGMLADLYITSTNALTKDGKLVNADGSGNRVAALIFGPKKVLVVTGINKIVENVEEGFKRIMEVAAVKNVDRMNSKSIEMGKEPKHNLDNIANKFSYIKADEKDRISIIIVNEELGY